MRNKKGGLGAAVAALAVGTLLLGGFLGGKIPALDRMLHIAGIICVLAGIGIAGITIAAMVAAFSTGKKDGHQETKNEINSILTARQQDITKLKSTASVMALELRKIQTKITEINEKIDTCDRKSEEYVLAGQDLQAREQLTKKQNYLREKDNLMQSYENYRQTVENAERTIAEAEADLLNMQMRSYDAAAKMKEAEYLMKEQETVSTFEEKAQHDKDYAEAYRSLGR